MPDIIFFQEMKSGFTKGMKGISVPKALELLRKHKAVCRRGAERPKESSYLEILFESPSEIPFDSAAEVGGKRYLLVFDQPGMATKIYKEC